MDVSKQEIILLAIVLPLLCHCHDCLAYSSSPLFSLIENINDFWKHRIASTYRKSTLFNSAMNDFEGLMFFSGQKSILILKLLDCFHCKSQTTSTTG